MKVFISYKFRGADKDILRNNIEYIYSLLKKEGHTPFNFFGDVEKWEKGKFDPGEVMRQAFKHIESSQSLVALIDSPEPSEGMLLEIGYALALKKEITILKHQSIDQATLTSLVNNVIQFGSIEEVNSIFNNK